MDTNIIVRTYIFPAALCTSSLLFMSFSPVVADDSKRPPTICNPMNLAYCFQNALPSRREAADPAVVVYRGEYWLFASKSQGYWRSGDFINWTFVTQTGLPIDNYAPAPAVIDGKLYWTAIDAGIYTTDDPGKGEWRLVSDPAMKSPGDPALFQDDDGRVYLYSGCSDGGTIDGQELDPKNGFKPLGERKGFFKRDIADHGAEIFAEPDVAPPYKNDGAWIEGSWMTKHDGKYYLQYAAPATQFKSYNDGVYVADHPLGPFTYVPYSPFSFKPTGFAAGAGHSGTFRDLGRRYWHIATMTVSMRHMFERRLGVFPTWFTRDGQIVTNTYLGDYPQYAPGVVKDPSKGNQPGWMLLDYKKAATASSTLDMHPVEAAFDEDMRTWWSARTGDPGEWLQVDMGKICRVDALQINFADEGSTQLGRLQDGYGYKLDVSSDGTRWTTIADHSTDRRDAPHDYIQLDKPIMARYARITNTHSPGGAKFSLSGLRLFGSGLGKAPSKVAGIQVKRDTDSRQAMISWQASLGADCYIVRYGIAKDRLFSNYQVYDANTLHIHTLNAGTPYFFTVDAFNDNGVTPGDTIVKE